MRGQIQGVFHVPNDRLFFVTETKGGVEQEKCGVWNISAFLELFCFPGFAPYYSDSIMTIQKNPGRR